MSAIGTLATTTMRNQMATKIKITLRVRFQHEGRWRCGEVVWAKDYTDIHFIVRDTFSGDYFDVPASECTPVGTRDEEGNQTFDSAASKGGDVRAIG